MAQNKSKPKSKSKWLTILQRIFNVREWIDWARIRSGGEFIKDGAKKIFVPKPVRPVESFEEAKVRLKLTDDDLASRCRSLYRLSLMMFILSLVLLCYAFYHFFFGTVHAGILTLALSSLSAAIAFRYHFWYFQIKSHKLGCTFIEWYREGLMGSKS